jgi:hypothetical protein
VGKEGVEQPQLTCRIAVEVEIEDSQRQENGQPRM